MGAACLHAAVRHTIDECAMRNSGAPLLQAAQTQALPFAPGNAWRCSPGDARWPLKRSR